MLTRAARLFHTVRHLRPVQVYGRAAHLLRRVQPRTGPAPVVRTPAGEWPLSRWREPTMVGPTRFRFLNEEHECASADDWNDAGRSKLWLYNLHYFDDLDAVGAEARKAWHEALIRRWPAENPPPEGNGWEPYCLSLRIVNWCRFGWRGGVLGEEAVQSLAVQARALADQLEVHLLGNHLFENAKALVFAGLFFEGAEADRWQSLGVRYLRRELREQILADGGHFERSPMYHNIIAAGVLEVLAADRMASGVLPSELVAELEEALAGMLAWAAAMCHDDGDVSFFNDSALGVAPRLQDLGAQAGELGIMAEPGADASLEHLAASGYVRARSGPALLLADVGEVGPAYLPGHAHADTLSCELSLDGHRLLVNGGTSTYAATPERLQERGTAAHNTVVVDGQDSSEVWSSFRVARRARPRGFGAEVREDGVAFRAAHDGYRRLPGRVLHSRRWELAADRLIVLDEFEGRPESCVAYWHFHPEAVLEQIAPDRFRCLAPNRRNCEITLAGCEAEIAHGWWSPAFGRRVPNVHLRALATGPLIETQFRW